jgi:hypothetical protein
MCNPCPPDHDLERPHTNARQAEECQPIEPKALVASARQPIRRANWTLFQGGWGSDFLTAWK